MNACSLELSSQHAAAPAAHLQVGLELLVVGVDRVRVGLGAFLQKLGCDFNVEQRVHHLRLGFQKLKALCTFVAFAIWRLGIPQSPYNDAPERALGGCQ